MIINLGNGKSFDFTSCFLFSRPHSLQRVKKTERYLISLPKHHQKLLSKYREHLQEVKNCIENNDEIIKLIIKDVAHIFENVSPASSNTDSVRSISMVCRLCHFSSVILNSIKNKIVKK